MPFKFPLAPVLRYREACERKELLALQRLQQKALAMAEEIEQIGARYGAAMQEAGECLASGTAVFQFRCARERADRLHDTREQLGQLLDANRQQQLEQTQRYVQTRTDRETVSAVRARAERSFVKEQDRREQSALDDFFGARLARRK